MKNNEITTTDLADFGARERGMLIDLLIAWEKQGLPDDFSGDRVHAMFNRNSGNVFLINEELDVAMLNGDKLEMWRSCHNCGNEGFAEDCHLFEEGCNQCIEGE